MIVSITWGRVLMEVIIKKEKGGCHVSNKIYCNLKTELWVGKC